MASASAAWAAGSGTHNGSGAGREQRDGRPLSEKGPWPPLIKVLPPPPSDTFLWSPNKIRSGKRRGLDRTSLGGKRMRASWGAPWQASASPAQRYPSPGLRAVCPGRARLWRTLETGGGIWLLGSGTPARGGSSKPGPGLRPSRRLPTLHLLRDPQARSSFSRSAGFRDPGLWNELQGSRLRSGGTASGHNAPESGPSARNHSTTRRVPGVHAQAPLPGVRAPQSSPRGNSREDRAWGRRGSRSEAWQVEGASARRLSVGLLGREGSQNAAATEWVTPVDQTPGCAGRAISPASFPGLRAGLWELPRRAAARSALLL
ncbi:uncharacterized protein AAES06_018559 [Glossophaga mutica]